MSTAKQNKMLPCFKKMSDFGTIGILYILNFIVKLPFDLQKEICFKFDQDQTNAETEKVNSQWD